MIDAKAFGAELAGIVKAQVAPVLARLDALEKRIDALPAPKEVRDGIDGKDADPEAVAAIVLDQIKADLDNLRAAVDAIPPVPELPEFPDVPALIEETVAEAIKALPAPEKGKDGTSVALEDVLPALQKQVEEFLAAIPAPKDGRSIEMSDLDAEIAARVAKAVAALPAPEKGKDGVGVAGALIDRDGALVLTLSSGEVKALGPVVGRSVDEDQISRQIADLVAKAVAEIPVPKDGADGLGFDDWSVAEKDGRLVLRMRRGDVVKDVPIPGLYYRGVFREGEYFPGDSVTFGGSQWIARTVTSQKPGDGDDWQLAVKKGRDGKDGDVKPPKGGS